MAGLGWEGLGGAARRGKWQKRRPTDFFCPSVPVSRPVLTLSPPGARALEGDVMTLHCEAQRGSAQVQYIFYREDVPLTSRWARSGAGASFHLALLEEHSANYSCTADNGFGPQRSEAVSLWVIGKPCSHPSWPRLTPTPSEVCVDLQCPTPVLVTEPFIHGPQSSARP